MKLINPLIPENLAFARELRGYSKTEFAEIMNNSTGTISNWESGKRSPDFGTIRKIANNLNVTYAFLVTPQKIETITGMSMYRSKAAVPNKIKLSFERTLQEYEKMIRIIGNRVSMPKYKLEDLNIGKTKFQVLNDKSILEKAQAIRDFFDLGNGPISNMAALIERAGIQLIYVKKPGTGVHALTTQINDNYLILLNISDQSAVRVRFSLAHELGHIILHSSYKKEVYNNKELHKRLEAEANYFAGCLLLPEDGFLLDVTRPTLNGLIELKPHWLVSIQTMAVRLNQLNIIDTAQKTLIFKEISRKYSRKEEPFDAGENKIKIEFPSLVNAAIMFAQKNNLSFLKEFMKYGLTTEYLNDIFPYLIINKDDKNIEGKGRLRLI